MRLMQSPCSLAKWVVNVLCIDPWTKRLVCDLKIEQQKPGVIKKAEILLFLLSN